MIGVRIGSLLTCAAATLLLVGCSQPHPTLGELKLTPGADTSYPGATIYSQSPVDSAARIGSSQPASITTEACAAADPDSVLSYFGQQLQSKGWRPDTSQSPVIQGKFTAGAGWVRDGRRFDLHIDSVERATVIAQQARATNTCPIAYQTLLQ